MNIAILFGGSSFEHEISIVSAITMKKVLKKSTLTYIFVDANREFYLIDTDKINSKLFSSGEYKKGKQLTLKKGGFFADGMFGSKEVSFDVVLNLIHGRDGEDGKISSMMEFYGIPFISPRTEASALSLTNFIPSSWQRVWVSKQSLMSTLQKMETERSLWTIL